MNEGCPAVQLVQMSPGFLFAVVLCGAISTGGYDTDKLNSVISESAVGCEHSEPSYNKYDTITSLCIQGQ